MPVGDQPEDLLADARAGKRLALARLLSLVERGGELAREIGATVYPQVGGTASTTYSVGITGAPGGGKSTVTTALVHLLRAQRDDSDAAQRVAVLAIDPSSPYTGGAILGDRVRMGEHAADDGVYIRSMATRGHMGGLSLATPQAVRVLDAAGWPLVLIETVGVGQVEVEVAGAADTTVVVLNPGWGDAIQANKAGLMEVADIFVINKADRPGLDDTRRDIHQMLDMSDTSAWTPPVVATVATNGDGIDELLDAIGAHRAHLERSGELIERRRARAVDELTEVLHRMLEARVRTLGDGDALAEATHAVVSGAVDPYAAAERLVDVALG